MSKRSRSTPSLSISAFKLQCADNDKTDFQGFVHNKPKELIVPTHRVGLSRSLFFLRIDFQFEHVWLAYSRLQLSLVQHTAIQCRVTFEACEDYFPGKIP